MIDTQRHRVKRQSLRLRVEGIEQAKALQERLSRLQRARLVPVIDRVCSELSPPDRLHRIESLDLDLGTVDIDDFEEEFVSKFQSALRKALGEEITVAEVNTDDRGGHPRTRSRLELLERFARTGTLPWRADSRQPDLLQEHLRGVMADAPQPLTRLLRDLSRDPRALQRIILHCDDTLLAELAGLLYPSHETAVISVVRELLEFVRSSGVVAAMPPARIRILSWQQVFSAAIEAELDKAAPDSLVRDMLVRIARESAATYESLLSRLHRDGESSPTRSSATLHKIIRSAYQDLQRRGSGEARDSIPSPPTPGGEPPSPDIAAMKGGEGLPRTLDEPGKDDGSPARPAAALPGVKVHPGAGIPPAPASRSIRRRGTEDSERRTKQLCSARGDRERPEAATGATPSIPIPPPPSYPGEASGRGEILVLLELLDGYGGVLAELSAPLRALLAQSTAGVPQASLPRGFERPGTEGRVAGCAAEPRHYGALSRLRHLIDLALTRDSITPELIEQCRAYLRRVGDSHPLTEPNRAAADLLRQALDQTPTAAPGPKSPSLKSRPPDEPGLDPADELFVSNAGLVILWPFLGHFFSRLGLLEAQRFKDEETMHRAVGLLQYLVVEQELPPEYLLPLNKILCAMALNELFDFGPPPTDDEAQECTALLTAVIGHAPVLRNMSIPGFRGTFLLRDGVLSTRDGAWLLRVERQTYDLVLDRFPWTWSWVRLPWMPAPLRVEW